jgi:hypothetical protein
MAYSADTFDMYFTGNYLDFYHNHSAFRFQGATSYTGLMTFSGTTGINFTSTAMTKGINFGSSKMVGGASNAAFAYGTWNNAVWITSLAGHYVPIQVNLHSSASAAYDVAAARFRVDADADTLNTSTFVNVIEGRSALNGTIAGHAGFNMSTNIASNTTCTGDLIPILAKIEGSGNVTSSNKVYPFESTVTGTGTGINGVGYFDANGCTVTDGVKIETHNSATITNMLNIANSSGTGTNGINISGTYSGYGITSTSSIYAGAGVTLPSASKHIWAAGGSVDTTIRGINTACKNGDRFWVELMISYNDTITGISYVVGSVGGTDSVVIQLCNYLGVQVATTRAVGQRAALVGTTNTFQSVAFTTPYAAKAGLYYVVLQFNGTTARFRTYSCAGLKIITGTTTGTWNTKADITPGTTYTGGKGPICITY